MGIDEEEEDDNNKRKEMQKGEACGGEGLSDRERQEKMEKRAARRKKASVAPTVYCRCVGDGYTVKVSVEKGSDGKGTESNFLF